MSRTANRTTSRSKERTYLHFTALGVLFLVLFLLQGVGLFPSIGGARPLLLVSAVISASLFLRQWGGAVFGCAAGLFLDASSSGAGCFHTLTLLVIGCVCGLLITNLLNNTLAVNFLLQAGFLFLYVVLRWLFFYVFPGGYDDVGHIFLKYGLGDFLYTFVLSIPLYLLIRRLMRQVHTVA